MKAARLRVAAAAPYTITDDLEANVIAHADAIRDCAAAVVAFPELSLTGYSMDAPAVDVRSLTPVIEACGEVGSVALIGAPVRHDGGRAVGVIAADGDGARVVYRKMFLGGAEVDSYTAGFEPGIVVVDGWRIGIGICKDTRIDAHLAATAHAGMDVYAAGLVHAPHELDELDTRATRIAGTYGVPVVFAAFAGPTGGGYSMTSGGSAIWDADGRCMARAGSKPGEWVAADLEN